MTTKQIRRRMATLKAQLATMSYAGWDRFTAIDWQPLELELDKLQRRLEER